MANTKTPNLPIYRQIQLVEGPLVDVYNVCPVLKEIYGDAYWEVSFNRPSYTESRERVEAWGKEHGASFYARDREDFSFYEAASEANALGLTRVIVEDLS